MGEKSFFLPEGKYLKASNPDYSYNQSKYVGGFRNDCSGFVSDVLRTNGYEVPRDFTTANITKWASDQTNPYFLSVGLGKNLTPLDIKSGDVVMLGSGHAGIVFEGTDGSKYIADWGATANGFRSKAEPLEDALKPGGWYGLPVNQVIRPKPEIYHPENDQTAAGQAYANPALPAITDTATQAVPDTQGYRSDPMGSDDGHAILNAATGNPTPANTQPTASITNTGPDASTHAAPVPSLTNAAEKPLEPSNTVASKPAELGDAVDAPLPDGTRMVSVTSTVNGQNTVSAQLVDKDGHVLLSAGSGQTMVRDPETGVVQVLTNGSDSVQQYDPASGEVSTRAVDNDSSVSNANDKALQEAFGHAEQSAADIKAQYPESTQLADASGHTGGSVVSDAGGGGAQDNSSSDDSANTCAQETTTTQGQSGLTTGQAQGGVMMFNAVEMAQHWSQMDAMQRVAVLGQMYMAAVQISQGQTSLGDGADGVVSGLNFWNAVEHGQTLQAVQSGLQLTQAGLNAYSTRMAEVAQQMMDDMVEQGTQSAAESATAEAAAESARESAAASSAAGSAVPYVSYAIALANFIENPERAACIAVGTYAGESIGAAMGGPVGAVVGGAVGGLIGGMFGDEFSNHNVPPPPDGAAHFSWDVNGNIQHTIDYDQSNGGVAANDVAASVQEVLQNIVVAHNAQNASSADDIAINPYLLPTFGVTGRSVWMEVRYIDGLVGRESVEREDFGTHLLKLLQDNGALAPSWEVQTQQRKWQQVHEQLLSLQAQRSEVVQDDTSQLEFDIPQAKQILPAQDQHNEEMSARVNELKLRVSELEQDFKMVVGAQGVGRDEAQSVQGSAADSADFNSQTFGVLVVHLNESPGLIAAQTQFHQVLSDIDTDGYLEKTQVVAATDNAGKLQAVLTLDFNGDGVIQTSDILNLGGNANADNPSEAAQLAYRNASQQRNNVDWLDANGDGVLDKRDPAFAVIRLWVDANQDGVQQRSESISVQRLHISSFNFKTGEVTYEDGHVDALTAHTLKADTEGVKFTDIQEANPDGSLRTLEAGAVWEHEGYQGKVEMTDDAGTRWVSVRKHTYEQQALRTGDWEETAEEALHRHGGGNLADAPAATTATGATNLVGAKMQANAVTHSEVLEGDVRLVSGASVQSGTDLSGMNKQAQSPAQTTVTAGDVRLKSNAPSASATTTSNPANVASVVSVVSSAVSVGASGTGAGGTSTAVARAGEARIAFVPVTQNVSIQNDLRLVTDTMIESAQSVLFGAVGNAGLGVLAAVGLGATQSAQAAAQTPVLVRDSLSSNSPYMDSSSVSTAKPNVVSEVNLFSTSMGAASPPAVLAPVVFRQVDLGVLTPQPLSAGHNTAGAAPADVAVPVQTGLSAMVMVSVNASGLLPKQAANPAAQHAATTGSEAIAPDAAQSASEASAFGVLTAQQLTSSGAPFTALSLSYPVVQAETLPGSEDVVLRLPTSVLLANDGTPNASADPTQAALSISAVASPVNGQVSLVNGEVLFAPAANFHGTASFSYSVTDQYGLSVSATATLEIAAVNDAPLTQGEQAQGDEDTGLIFTQAQLLANDSDVDVLTDGQVKSISRVGQALHGTVWLDSQGDLRFVPDANYHGPAQFTYWVSDGAGAETPALVNLTIAAVNDVPVAQGEATSAVEDSVLLIAASALLANDSDVDTTTDAQVLQVIALSGAFHCTVSLQTQLDGTQFIHFAPEANYHGVASFDYTVSDGSDGSAVATAVVNLSAVNDAPVVTGESATSDEDQVLLFSSQALLVNDSDVDTATDGQALRISRVSDASHGAVTLDDQGQLRFTPDANYHGPAQFTYWVSDGLAMDGAGAEVPATVTLSILAVNDLPVVQYETVSTNEDTTLLFDPATLLANDSDVDVATDSQVLSITAVSNATHGTVAFVMQPAGSCRIAFTPEANFFGVASYQYTVSDGNGGNTVGTVVVNLAQVNDTPVAAADSLSSTEEDSAVHISFASLLGNDTDADSLNSQWGGTNDVLTVFAVGNAVHGMAELVDGEVVFTPEANYHGPASFIYQVVDSAGAMTQALATFTVTAVNDIPVAVGETISVNEDTALLISQAALLQNDSDVDVATDGQVPSITAVFNAQHGAVTLNADGTIAFVPDANFFGDASFDYTLDDGNGGTAKATATIALAAVNDAPVGLGETISSAEDQVLTIAASALLQNDADVDNALAELSIARVQSGAGGTVSLNASGDVVFTPTANYNGVATFTYWVKDSGGLESNPVTTTVVLSAVNDAPSAQGETVYGASEDAVFSIKKTTLLANNHDVDDPDSALSLSWVGNATGGSVSLDAGGNVVFTPFANFNGNARFDYKVRDAAGLESATVQAVIPVAAVNDAPVAVDDQFTTYKNSTLSINFNQLTGNDNDVDSDALSVTAVRDNANGHAEIVNGLVQFVATPGYTGAATFDYLSDDSHGGRSWATAFVDVKNPPNLYASVSWTSSAGLNSQKFMAGFVIQDYLNVGFTIADDGDPTVAQMRLISASFGNSGGSVWSDAGSSYTLNRSGSGGSFHFQGFFNLIKTSWSVVDDKGLENIWHFDITSWINSQNYSINSYNEHSGYYTPPVILDLNGNGVHYTSLQDSNVKIDVNFDGLADGMAWAANEDGVLVWDKDHNGRISDASEFGFQSLKAGAQTDLEGLQALDTNGNGLLDAADQNFAEFGVWQDSNGNGVTDAGEFKSLMDLGIANINLHSDGQVREAGSLLANSVQNGSGETDAVVMGTAAFTRTDGSTGVVADTLLAFEPVLAGRVVSSNAAGSAQPANVSALDMPLDAVVSASSPQPQALLTDLAAAQAHTAEVLRQALLFNQVCNTAMNVDSAPLGFVPIQPDGPLEGMLSMSSDIDHQQLQAA